MKKEIQKILMLLLEYGKADDAYDHGAFTVADSIREAIRGKLMLMWKETNPDLKKCLPEFDKEIESGCVNLPSVWGVYFKEIMVLLHEKLPDE